MVDAPASAAPPHLVDDVAGSIAATDEVLTVMEASYLRLAKAESDRQLGVSLNQIIETHGHNPTDGRRYNFVEEDGRLVLRIGQ